MRNANGAGLVRGGVAPQVFPAERTISSGYGTARARKRDDHPAVAGELDFVAETGFEQVCRFELRFEAHLSREPKVFVFGGHVRTD